MEEARKRKTWLLEIATFVVLFIYAGLTFWQARSTAHLVKITEDNTKKQLRAYVTIDEIKLRPDGPVTANIPTQFIITFKNTGQTPAQRLVFTPLHGDEVSSSLCTTVISKPVYYSVTNLGPGQLAHNANNAFEMGAGCIDAISQGRVPLKIRGMLTYDDIFGEHHHTGFCAQYEALTTRQMSACQDGEDMD